MISTVVHAARFAPALLGLVLLLASPCIQPHVIAVDGGMSMHVNVHDSEVFATVN